MDFQKYSQEFRAKAENAGYSEENILLCINYAEKLFRKKVPIIYTTSHLAALVGYQKNYLKRAVKRPEFFYREFKIKKRNGDYRVINEPLTSLKEIQFWLLKNILYKIPVSRYAKAYIKKRTIIDNVKFHKNQKSVLSIDIEDFFSSISFQLVEDIFLKVGYSELISNLLAKLCCLDQKLPQGAPTSPAISNIVLYSFDQSIASFCKKNDVRYTRYADDLTFSSDLKSINWDELISLIENKLTDVGLKLNRDKTRIMTNSQRQIVTGIVVNEVIQVPKEKRKKIRQIIYYIKKFGLESQLKFFLDKNKNLKNKNRWTIENYLNHLIGSVNYMLYLKKNDQELLDYKSYLLELKNT
ncbi:MAG: retron St85 family RNA-directed DNA polymerase [Aureispira sp.]